MKKYVAFLALTLLVSVSAAFSQNKNQPRLNGYAIGFYNLENLFDTCHDVGHNDYSICLMAATNGTV